MPLLLLTRLLHEALPALSAPSRAVLSALACRNGSAGSAAELAALAGLRDRYQMSRALRRDGLPPLRQLAGWARVIYWVAEAESLHVSLLSLAQREHLHPAAAYRLVRRVTGVSWSEMRRGGLERALRRLSTIRLAGRPARSRDVSPADTAAAPIVPPSRAAGAEPRVFEGILAGRVALDAYPFDVAVASTGVALVTCGHAAALDVVGLEPFRRLGAIATGAVPTRVRVSRSGETAYVTNQFSEEVAVIDLVAGVRRARIAVPGHALGAALAPDERTLYVTTNLDRLHGISLRSHRVMATAQIPMGIPQICVHPAGHRVYVAGWRAGSVTECDASTLRAVRTFELGGITQDLLVTSAGLLLVANQAGWLDVVALATGRHVTRIRTEGPAFGLAMDPGEAHLLVSLLFDGMVGVFDVGTWRRRATLRPGGKPRLMAFAPHGSVAFVANEYGWLDRII